MSSFVCGKCGTNIIDTPKGYITGCKHYPLRILRLIPPAKPGMKKYVGTEFVQRLLSYGMGTVFDGKFIGPSEFKKYPNLKKKGGESHDRRVVIGRVTIRNKRPLS